MNNLSNQVFGLLADCFTTKKSFGPLKSLPNCGKGKNSRTLLNSILKKIQYSANSRFDNGHTFQRVSFKSVVLDQLLSLKLQLLGLVVKLIEQQFERAFVKGMGNFNNGKLGYFSFDVTRTVTRTVARDFDRWRHLKIF